MAAVQNGRTQISFLCQLRQFYTNLDGGVGFIEFVVFDGRGTKGGQDLAFGINDLGVKMLITPLDDQAREITSIEKTGPDATGTLGLSGV